MDTLNGLRNSLSASTSDHCDMPCCSSRPGSMPSCQYSSAISDLRESPYRSVDNTTTMSYGLNSGFEMQCGDHYLWNGAEMSRSDGSYVIPFCSYLPSNAGSTNNICSANVISNADNVTSSSAMMETNSTTSHSVVSPGASHDTLIQTTPINSLLTIGDSQRYSYQASLLSYSESLKKKDSNINAIWDINKIPTLKSAKRNLKYLPAKSRSNKWMSNTEGTFSDCMHAKNTDLHNEGKSLNSFSKMRYDSEYPSAVNITNDMQLKTEIPTNNKVGSIERSNERKVDSINECLDDAYSLSKSTTISRVSTAQTNRRIPQNVPYGYKSATEIEKKTITNEITVDDKENNKSRAGSIENQPIVVGPPIRVTNLLDYIPTTFGEISNLQHSENTQIVCSKCICQTLDIKPQLQTISSENNNTRDPDSNKENPNVKNGSTHLQALLTCPVKNWSNDKTAEIDSGSNSSKKSENKLQLNYKPTDGINGPQLQVDESSMEMKGWLKLLIEVEDKGDNKSGSHLCFGCQKPVFDRYVIQVKDHGFWHAECLKCSNCQDNLSGQKSCYVKNEQVFCRNDYNILFGLSCVKCSLQFKREQDWMRVAGQHRYHIACFLCKICKRQLGNNEKYHLVNGTDIYCTNHYRDMVNGESSDGQQPPKKAKRNRTSYTEAQIKFLQDRFLRDSNPDGNELEKIATHINLKKRVVQVWFQNNRARLKKSANNTKGGNQENKNPSMNSGVTGNGGITDAMSIDWDNSLEQSSLDEHTYPNSASPSQMRPGSAHFMDTAYSLTSSFNGPLLCLPTGGSSSATLTQEPSSLGDGSGSGTSTCGTPRDQQVSPHFSDMSNPAYQGSESVGTATLGGNDSSGNDLSGAGSNNYSGSTNNSSGCGSKGASSPNIILSALRSSVMRDKFSTSCQRRMGTREQQEQDMRNHMMMFQDQPLRHHQQQSYHIDVPYGSHMGIYSNLYNVYSGYGPLNCLTSDQNAEQTDSHHSFLRIRGDQPQIPSHQSADQSFEPHYNGEGHNFSRSHIDMHTGLFSTRPPFVDTISHVTNSGNAGANGNSSPLSFLGASAPNSLLQSRSSSEQCAYLQGHQTSSPLACGQSLNFVRSHCESPAPSDRQNGASYLHAMSRSGENFFVDGETA